jgi:DNA-binding NarL/FixJ family response regulator
MESGRNRYQSSLYGPNGQRRNGFMVPYRIVLADDHVMFRQGIKRIIEGTEGLEVVEEVNDGFELLELLREIETDMVLLDISMPNIRGIEATREIRSLYPQVKVLILTMHKKKEYLYHAFMAGARGYLLKEDSDVELLTAIERIRKGGFYVTRHLAGELAEDISLMHKGNAQIPSEPLTMREREVLTLVAAGKSNRQIADLLYISIRTVDGHRANIMRKLSLKSTAEIVKYAILKGYTWLTT